MQRSLHEQPSSKPRRRFVARRRLMNDEPSVAGIMRTSPTQARRRLAGPTQRSLTQCKAPRIAMLTALCRRALPALPSTEGKRACRHEWRWPCGRACRGNRCLCRTCGNQSVALVAVIVIAAAPASTDATWHCRPRTLDPAQEKRSRGGGVLRGMLAMSSRKFLSSFWSHSLSFKAGSHCLDAAARSGARGANRTLADPRNIVCKSAATVTPRSTPPPSLGAMPS